MYNTTMTQPDAGFFMNQYLSWQAATKENKWQGRNVSRWTSKEYDDIHKQADQELDAVKRAAMYIKLNDLVVCGQLYPAPAPAAEGFGHRQQFAGACQRLGQ